MLVLMRVTVTHTDGGLEVERREGKVYDLSDVIAQQWIARGYAERAGEAKAILGAPENKALVGASAIKRGRRGVA